MDSKASADGSEASLSFSTFPFLPASHLEVELSDPGASSETAEPNPLHSRGVSSDPLLSSSKKVSLDDREIPITRHRHRRRKIDQSPNANRSSTPSHTVAARPKKPTTSPASSDYPVSGFSPRLSRILEHKDEDIASRLSESPINNNQEQRSRYRRNDAINVDRERTARYRTYQLQQEFSSLSNPSLSSLFSTLTTSSGSSGSSTITQRSYDRSVSVRRKRRLKHRNRGKDIPPEGRDFLKLLRGRRSDYMDPMDGQTETTKEESLLRRNSRPPSRASLGTFSLVSGGHHEGPNIHNSRPRSRASSQASSSAGDRHDEDVEKEEKSRSTSRASSRASSSTTESHDEETWTKGKPTPTPQARPKASSSDSSSETDEPPPKVTSIAAKRKSYPPSPSSGFMSKKFRKRQDTFNSDSGISVSSSPEFNNRPEQVPSSQQSESEEADSDDGSSDPSSSDEDGEVEQTRPFPTARSSSTTITSADSQPRALMDNDPLVQRLQEQEEEMRVHMDLHSPQPKRKFRPPVTSPCEPSPALPLFDSRASSTIPAHFALPPQAPELPHRNVGYLHPQYPHAIPPPQPFNPDPTRKTVAGYELLAEKLAEQSQEDEREEEVWTPVYRKFAQLNHRILLHLQDEISVLEEDLRIVDECIAQRAEIMEGEVPPASRRMEMRYGNEPHHRRTELLGRIFQKLGQYNQALASYASASKNYSPAQSADVSAYRAWMAEHEPVDDSESRFLEHEKDLMALKKKPVQKSSSSSLPLPPPPEDPRQEKLLLIAALLIPPLAISLVPGILAKIVIMAILAFTGFIILESPASSVVGFAAIHEKKESVNIANVAAKRKEPNHEQSLTRSRPKHRRENI